MLRVRLDNRSGYDTTDIRRVVTKGLRARGVRGDVGVVVVPSPIRSRGCAEVGKRSCWRGDDGQTRCRTTVYGKQMVIAVASPSYGTTEEFYRRLSRLIDHEADHLLGLDHEDMAETDLYSLGPTSPWMRGERIRYLGRARQRAEERVSASALQDQERRGADAPMRWFYVYVVKLEPVRGRPRVYVGSSAHRPEVRMRHHLQHPEGSRHVRRAGIRLLPRLYERLNPLRSREEARRVERRLARRLHRLGYDVEGACRPSRRGCRLG